MTSYKVTLQVFGQYETWVDADSEKAACEIAISDLKGDIGRGCFTIFRIESSKVQNDEISKSL